MRTNYLIIPKSESTLSIYCYPISCNVGQFIFNIENKVYKPEELVDTLYTMFKLINSRTEKIDLKEMLDKVLDYFKISSKEDREVYYGFLNANIIGDI